MIMAIPAIRYAIVCSNRVLKPVLTISSPGVQEATASPTTQTHAMNLSAILGFFIQPLCNENSACRNVGRKIQGLASDHLIHASGVLRGQD
jgi:hypothetical protein